MTTPMEIEMVNAAGDTQTVTVGEGQSHNSGELSALLANGYNFAGNSGTQQIAMLTQNNEGQQTVEYIPASNVRSYMERVQEITGQRPMVVTGDSGAQEYINNVRRDGERAERVRDLSQSWQGAATGLLSGAASPWLAVARMTDDATGGGRSNNFFTGLSEVSEARPGMQMAGNIAMMLGTGGAAGIAGSAVGASVLVGRGAAAANLGARSSRLLQLGAGVAAEEALWAGDMASLEMMRENPNLTAEALLGGAAFGASVGLLLGPHLRAFRRASAAGDAHIFPRTDGQTLVEMARNPPMHPAAAPASGPRVSAIADRLPALPYISTHAERLAGAPRFPRPTAAIGRLIDRVTRGRITSKRHLNNLGEEVFPFYENEIVIRDLNIPEEGVDSVLSRSHDVAAHLEDSVTRYDEALASHAIGEGAPGLPYQDLVPEIGRTPRVPPSTHVMTDAQLQAIPEDVNALVERIVRGETDAFSAAERQLQSNQSQLVERLLRHHQARAAGEEAVRLAGTPAGAGQVPTINTITELARGLDDVAFLLDEAAIGGGVARNALTSARDAADFASARLLTRRIVEDPLLWQSKTKRIFDRTSTKDPLGIIRLNPKGGPSSRYYRGSENMLRETHAILFETWRKIKSIDNPLTIGLANALSDILRGEADASVLLGRNAGEGILRNRATELGGDGLIDNYVKRSEAPGFARTELEGAFEGQYAETIGQLRKNRSNLAEETRPNIFGEAASTRFRNIANAYEAGHNARQMLDEDFLFKKEGFSGKNILKRFEEDMVHSAHPLEPGGQLSKMEDNLQRMEEATDILQGIAPTIRPPGAGRMTPEALGDFMSLMRTRGQHRQYVSRGKTDVLGAVGNLMIAQTAGGLIGSLTGMSSLGWLMGMGAGVAALTLKQMDVNPARFLLYQGKMRASLVAYRRRLATGRDDIRETLETSSRLAMRAERYARIPGRQLGFRILTPEVSREDRIEEYNILRERLVSLYNDPMLLTDELEMSFAPMERVNPAVAAAARATAQQAAYYLAANMPPPEYDPLVAGRIAIQPSMAEIDSFVARFRAIQDPLGILSDLASGTLRHESADAVRNVYPNVMADITSVVGMVVEEMGDRVQNIPYQARVNLDLLVGSPTDTTLTGGFIELMQNRFAQTPQQAQAQGMSRASPRSIQIASSYLTEGQALGQRN